MKKLARKRWSSLGGFQLAGFCFFFDCEVLPVCVGWACSGSGCGFCRFFWDLVFCGRAEAVVSVGGAELRAGLALGVVSGADTAAVPS